MDASKDHHALLDDFERIEDADVDTAASELHRDSHRPLQKELSVRECIHAYYPAIFWSLLLSMTVIMEGYDTILMGNCLKPSVEKTDF